MEQNIILSIIIPVYNQEPYIKECLDSIIVQDLSSVEIICVNDGSTDCSANILENYSKSLAMMKIVTKENGGLSSARNAGIKVANGSYIMFLDGDDKLSENNILLKLKQIIVSHQDLDMILYDAKSYNDGVNNDEFDKYKDSYQRKNNYNNIVEGKYLFQSLVSNDEYFPSACMYLIQRKFIIDNNLFFTEGILHEDNPYTFKALLSAKKSTHTPMQVIHRRVHNDSIMQCPVKYTNFISMCKCIFEMQNFINNNIEDYICILPEAEKTIYICKFNAKNIFNEIDINEKNKLLNAPDYLKYIAEKYVFEKGLDAIYSDSLSLNKLTKETIVIYGATNYGYYLYTILTKQNVNVLAIADKNYKNIVSNPQGALIVSPSFLNQNNYEYVIVSVTKKFVFEEIKKELLEMGVRDEKIVWIWNLLENDFQID